ncbi:endonuclease domain-containing protein [Francisella tularensis]|uniref:endonuclease domain-containing protein n=1 Tax=Francisella tularensis TaxID=263 RepID=UPI0008F5FB4D|nr:endonuclease domain-containing protein [Francisella tularensis]APA83526.1 hypothetical protein N894_1542 [Francisella tularensis subsp. novicida PA10-7858]
MEYIIEMAQFFNKEATKEKRRSLRKNQTFAEQKLWQYIRKDALGVRVRRQYGIGAYIADFYIPSLKIVIEVDGNNHFTDESKEYDLAREQYMKQIGIKTVRYTNSEVLNNIEAVFEDLLRVVKESI